MPDQEPKDTVHISAPGIMYAFWSFVLGVGCLMLSEMLDAQWVIMDLFFLGMAVCFFVETVFLLFLEPEVEIGPNHVTRTSRRPSIWRQNSHLFMVPHQEETQQLTIDHCTRFVLDYTRVPFPLPIPGLTHRSLSVYRWMIVLETDVGTSMLIAVEGSPFTLTDFGQKLQQRTGLPFHTPWDKREEKEFDSLDEKAIRNELFHDTTWKKEELPVPMTGRDHARFIELGPNPKGLTKVVGVTGYMILLLLFSGIVLAGFMMATRSGDLGFGLLSMVIGVLLSAISVAGLLQFLKPYRFSLKIQRDALQLRFRFGASDKVNLTDVIRVRANEIESEVSEKFGMGKCAPCFDIYTRNDWIHIPELTRTEFFFLKHLFAGNLHEHITPV